MNLNDEKPVTVTAKPSRVPGPVEDAHPAPPGWPRLLPGTQLIGPIQGSALREPPCLVRRCDGQVVQLSQLLYELAGEMDGREVARIAESIGARLNLRITPEQVTYVAEQKLAPLGLVASRDGSVPSLQRYSALLALRFRIGIVPERAVNAVARLLRPLFLPPLVLAAVAALSAFDVWLGGHGIDAGLRIVIRSPALGLALFGVVLLSMTFHECGHATACRYGGARPGRIGAGIYLVFPALYTEVTDSYRLSRPGRLRTDLGGIYFNVVFALITAATFVATGYEPLLIVVVTQQMMMLTQFIPWVRLDGYYVVSDLIGVPDLFARVKPIVVSIMPGRRPDPRVTELKRWARAAITTWVLTTIAVLGAVAIIIIVNAPNYVQRWWQSLHLQLHLVGYGARIGSIVDILTGAIGVIILLLPATAITLSCLLLCRRVGSWLARRRRSANPTRSASGLQHQNDRRAVRV